MNVWKVGIIALGIGWLSGIYLWQSEQSKRLDAEKCLKTEVDDAYVDGWNQAVEIASTVPPLISLPQYSDYQGVYKVHEWANGKTRLIIMIPDSILESYLFHSDSTEAHIQGTE